MPDDSRLAIGGNSPPLREILSERIIDLPDLLPRENADLTSRRDELLGMVERMPAAVADEEMAGRFGDAVKQIAACIKNAEARRVGDKEPTLQAGRLVDGFYRKVIDPLTGAKKTAEGRLTIYQREKAAEERRRREEVERLAREEATRLAREAAEREAAMKDAADLEAAVIVAEASFMAAADASKAAKAADAKPAELSRTRGDYAVASLRTFWDFRDLDRAALDLEALRQHLPMDGLERAVRAFVKAGGRQLAGVEIFENTATAVR